MTATVSGLPGLTARVPAGAAIDATRAKRAVVVTTLAVLEGSQPSLRGVNTSRCANRPGSTSASGLVS
jgi:hypothetical protein